MHKYKIGDQVTSMTVEDSLRPEGDPEFGWVYGRIIGFTFTETNEPTYTIIDRNNICIDHVLESYVITPAVIKVNE